MPVQYYEDKLYPLQDAVLLEVTKADVDFYLTGGTALGRFYLHHRYSDDLDFFVNQSETFKEQCRLIWNQLNAEGIRFEMGSVSDSFARILVMVEGVGLKVDFVNDVPYRYGDSIKKREFPFVDNWRNILSNKICALSRLEPKDYVDIVCIALKYRFNWEQILSEARNKDLWVEPLSVSKMIEGFPIDKLKSIKWIQQIPAEAFRKIVKTIASDVLSGEENIPSDLHYRVDTGG